MTYAILTAEKVDRHPKMNAATSDRLGELLADIYDPLLIHVAHMDGKLYYGVPHRKGDLDQICKLFDTTYTVVEGV